MNIISAAEIFLKFHHLVICIFTIRFIYLKETVLQDKNKNEIWKIVKTKIDAFSGNIAIGLKTNNVQEDL